MGELSDCRVLVVEDEYFLAKDIQHALRTAGAAILGPYPGNAEARAALRSERPDLAVLDVNLGLGPDFTLADELRDRAIPFIFFTGYDQEVIPDRFADVTRLEKPVDTARLVRAARTACGTGRADPPT